MFYFTEITYYENDAPVYIFEGLTITSVETDYLESATVKLMTEVSKFIAILNAITVYVYEYYLLLLLLL